MDMGTSVVCPDGSKVTFQLRARSLQGYPCPSWIIQAPTCMDLHTWAVFFLVRRKGTPNYALEEVAHEFSVTTKGDPLLDFRKMAPAWFLIGRVELQYLWYILRD